MINKTSQPKLHSKRYARMGALQALYQWNFTHDSVEGLIEEFIEHHLDKKADLKYFKVLVRGTIPQVPELDAILATCLDRSIADLSPVELAILRVASFELAHRIDVPYRVVINEALELAKEFGADLSYKYVNAVLDALAIKLRSI